MNRETVRKNWGDGGAREEEETCRFFAVERDRTCDLSFSVFVGDTFCQSLLPKEKKLKKDVRCERQRENIQVSIRTFVRTAMEANEFPKFIPMTVCDCDGGDDDDGISMGACALPFGICRPFRDIFFFYCLTGGGIWVCVLAFVPHDPRT
jgi:hypothetical protein